MARYDNLNFPITMVKGNDWEMEFRVTVNNTPVNLTNYTITGVVKPTRTSTTSTAMVCTITNASDGRFRVNLTDTNTSGFSLGSLYYQIDLTVSGFTQTYVAGNFFVR